MGKGIIRFSFVAAVVLALVLGGTGVSRAIKIREGQPGDLEVVFGAVKPVFEKGEAINFKVTGNRDFYLYLFCIDKASNKGYLLLPNDKSPDNLFTGGLEYTLPGGNIEFYSDKVGTEKIVMVASTVKLNLETSQYSKAGSFFQGTDEEMEQSIKSLRVREKEDRQQVFKEIDLVIVGD
ncbi:MAG: DUF4384 domain-containing protein [Deltaproteobacteria bacterium]|nr:DUF4384 domain-containing protein [Deltaproteobacteria bacterium]